MPEEITGSELDADVKVQLRGLGTDYARIVGRHIVATHAYLETDPELAWLHALAARRRAARLGVVREAVGLAAYYSGRYADALAEFRTARRLTGSSTTLPLMADSERGLGRPERALDLARSPEAETLDVDGRIELLIVAAGARTDLGQPEAAVIALQVPELETTSPTPWLARLRYAYAEALAAVGRADEAESWRARALAADPTGEANLTPTAPDEELLVIDLLSVEDDTESTDETEVGEATAEAENVTAARENTVGEDEPAADAAGEAAEDVEVETDDAARSGVEDAPAADTAGDAESVDHAAGGVEFEGDDVARGDVEGAPAAEAAGDVEVVDGAGVEDDADVRGDGEGSSVADVAGGVEGDGGTARGDVGVLDGDGVAGEVGVVDVGGEGGAGGALTAGVGRDVGDGRPRA